MKTIVLVDDAENVRHVLTVWLNLAGYTVFEAGNPAEAREILARTRVHLVVTDYAMPGETGLSLANDLRTHPDTSGMPIVVTTAMHLSEEQFKSLQQFDGFFPKPIPDMYRLSAKIRELIPLKVLVVDDEALLRGAICRMLSPSYTVVDAKDGQAGGAQAILEEPDLVLTDRNLPLRRGEEIARDVVTYLNTPVIMMTGDTLTDDERRAIAEIGIATVLAKPFERDELMTAVGAVLAAHARATSFPRPSP